MCAVPYRCRWSIGKRNQIGLAWESDGSFDGLMVWGKKCTLGTCEFKDKES